MKIMMFSGMSEEKEKSQLQPPASYVKLSNFLYSILWGCAIGLFGTLLVCCFIIEHSRESLMAGGLVSIVAVFMFVMWRDFTLWMNHSYVEIEGDEIRVTDYCFTIRREKRFRLSDIDHARIRWTRSGRRIVLYRGKWHALLMIGAGEDAMSIFGKYLEACDE